MKYTPGLFLFLFFTVTVCIPFATAEKSAYMDYDKNEFSKVRGIYVLLKVNGEVNPEIFSLPFIEGISIRARWSLLEPEYGKYRWDYIDNILKQAEGTGKKVMVRILPGVSSPKWIYDKGIKGIQFTPHREKKRIKFGNTIKTPLMWDKQYLSFWNNFNKAFSERYENNSEIVMVHYVRTYSLFCGDAPSKIQRR